MSKIKVGSVLNTVLSIREIAEMTELNYAKVFRLIKKRDIESQKMSDVLDFIRKEAITNYEKEKCVTKS